jgi:omega-6 fatty acid desaturase (delta-12 desaturase)
MSRGEIVSIATQATLPLQDTTTLSMTAHTSGALPQGGAPPSWREIIARHAKPDTRRGVVQLLNTGLPFLTLTAALIYGVYRDFWPALVLGVPAAALLVRLFMIQHDCGHGSFFRARWANNLVGRILGVLTLTPYGFWRRRHAVHHATSGNLDRRGTGDITTLTVGEYLALSPWQRFCYRLYRHPLVLFGIGPTFLFLIRHRIPTGNPFRGEARSWLSILGTNAAIAAVVVPVMLLVGVGPFVVAYMPVFLAAASIGVWLFYVQHQFEDVYWAPAGRWRYHDAAIEGCSFYDLPGVLRWVTANIGFHHIHHLSSKIPNYRLRDCFEQTPEFQQAKRLTLWSSLRCARLAVWDEEKRKLIPFRQIRRPADRQATAG